MPTIILSYRRDDTGAIAGRIFDRLVGHYGADQVFMDIDSIPFGLDFREHIQETLKRCDVLLAIVGKNWAAPDEKGGFRIAEENDWVRIEVEAALAKKIPVIPVLIDNASLPAPASLPEGLRNLVFRQAAPVDSGRDFNPHMARLIKAMDQLLTGQSASEAKPEAPAQTISQRKPRLAKRLPQDTDVTDKRAKSAKTGVLPEASRETSSAAPRLGQRLWLLAVSPKGRLARGTFAMAAIASFIALLALVIVISAVAALNENYNGTPKGAEILLIPFNWIMIALGAKRLHDLGWTAWLMAIPVLVGAALPYMGLALGDPINTIVLNGLGALACLLPFAFIRGTEGPNRYGPDPLGRPHADAGLA
jgi:uncharacterized membrane protein YhaH (DUF805 family)